MQRLCWEKICYPLSKRAPWGNGTIVDLGVLFPGSHSEWKRCPHATPQELISPLPLPSNSQLNAAWCLAKGPKTGKGAVC